MKHLPDKKLYLKNKMEIFKKISLINLDDFDLCDFLLNRERRSR